MVSFTHVFLALASALVVSADYYIDPNSVPLSTRQNWCDSEKQTCPLICLQTSSGAKINTCNATTLSYGCLCNDNKQPNASEYTLTLPYFVCVEWGVQCQAACKNDATCASNCVQQHPCGALSPTLQNTSTLTTATATGSASSTATGVTIYTGLGSTATASANSKSGAMPLLQFGAVYGLMGVVGSLFAGFALML